MTRLRPAGGRVILDTAGRINPSGSKDPKQVKMLRAVARSGPNLVGTTLSVGTDLI